MDSKDFLRSDFPPHLTETEVKHHARIEREAAIIARAEADIDADLGIDDDDLEQWLDCLDHDDNAPLPTPRSIGSAPR